jgi:dienelactone hydrolase
MKRSVLSVFSFCLVLQVKAQASYYDHIDFGTYSINYSDTILYDTEIHYFQYGYSGKAPLFVQVWFPSTINNTENRLNFGAYMLEAVPPELTRVYDQLTAQMDDIVIRDVIESSMETDEPIDYGTHTTEAILQKVKRIPTRSNRSKIGSTLPYPVIVYHHGSQGLSYENSIMAEYFASNGYVFITANFHLPYENTVYGLLPYEREKENKHNQSSARTLIQFAKSITSSNTLFYIGHSWGAQEGWCFLNDSALVNAFVSMETTIEYKTDTSKIKEVWPYVYDAISVKKNTFSIPILTLAAADDKLNFDYFKGLSSKEIIFAAYKDLFLHNSYTSMYMMRYFLGAEVNLPDSKTLLSQIKGYAQHVSMIHAFFESVQKKQPFRQSEFVNHFVFH